MQLLDAQRVSLQNNGERVVVDVREALGRQRVRRVLVDGFEAQRRQLRLVEKPRLLQPN